MMHATGVLHHNPLIWSVDYHNNGYTLVVETWNTKPDANGDFWKTGFEIDMNEVPLEFCVPVRAAGYTNDCLYEVDDGFLAQVKEVIRVERMKLKSRIERKTTKEATVDLDNEPGWDRAKAELEMLSNMDAPPTIH